MHIGEMRSTQHPFHTPRRAVVGFAVEVPVEQHFGQGVVACGDGHGVALYHGLVDAFLDEQVSLLYAACAFVEQREHLFHIQAAAFQICGVGRVERSVAVVNDVVLAVG